jgi:hypothetical protein
MCQFYFYKLNRRQAANFLVFNFQVGTKIFKKFKLQKIIYKFLLRAEKFLINKFKIIIEIYFFLWRIINCAEL